MAFSQLRDQLPVGLAQLIEHCTVIFFQTSGFSQLPKILKVVYTTATILMSYMKGLYSFTFPEDLIPLNRQKYTTTQDKTVVPTSSHLISPNSPILPVICNTLSLKKDTITEQFVTSTGMIMHRPDFISRVLLSLQDTLNFVVYMGLATLSRYDKRAVLLVKIAQKDDQQTNKQTYNK